MVVDLCNNCSVPERFYNLNFVSGLADLDLVHVFSVVISHRRNVGPHLSPQLVVSPAYISVL